MKFLKSRSFLVTFLRKDRLIFILSKLVIKYKVEIIPYHARCWLSNKAFAD